MGGSGVDVAEAWGGALGVGLGGWLLKYCCTSAVIGDCGSLSSVEDSKLYTCMKAVIETSQICIMTYAVVSASPNSS